MFQDPILEAFDHLAARRGAQPLVLAEDRRATVAEVAALSVALAANLERSGVTPGRLVGLCTGNGPAFLAGLLALRRCGAAAVLLEPRNASGDPTRVLTRLGASSLLTASPWAATPEDFQLDTIRGGESRSVAEDVAVVKLTSGSTGEARGIVTPSAALIADDAALARSMGLRANDRILAAIPMAHAYGLSSVAMPALMRGSPLIVPDPRSPFSGLHAVGRFEITFLPTAPSFLAALLRTSAKFAPAPSLRLVISAGAFLPPDTAAAFRREVGLPVHAFYGASESGGICFDREGCAAERGTVGTPIDGVKVSIEDADPDGTDPEGAGTLVVESAAVARAYLPDADPRLSDGRFRTGDLARRRDGEIELRGRRDDLINVRGRKVNPREVETVLSGHARVREVAVLKLQDPDAGERIRAVVVCDPPVPSATELMDWCRSHLSDYKVPRSLIFLDALPRTARGKLDRQALSRSQVDE